jgi:subtilase family serine protease
MKLRGYAVAVAAGLAIGAAGGISAQAAGVAGPDGLRVAVEGGALFLPNSSIVHPEDAGLRAHTNIVQFIRSGTVPGAAPYASAHPNGFSYDGETPASLACIYGVVSGLSTGCIPGTFVMNSAKGSKVIALVDAYDYPRAASDLATFSKYYGLPAATFSKVYANGKPGYDPGWEGEEALDIQYAHAIAPKAKLILVEALSAYNNDLLDAVTKASQLVAAAGGGEVSMSWGGSEWSDEGSTTSFFSGNKVVFFASTGDTGSVVEWPSVQPNVTAVGGTSIKRNGSTGAYMGEAAWGDICGNGPCGSGGGISKYYTRPAYQSAVQSVVGNKRGVPDISAEADPATGVWIYIKDQGGWGGLWGGTSLASPMMAAMVNAAGQFRASNATELPVIYSGLGGSSLRDVMTGKCTKFSATKGWDKCTGVGTPNGLGKL